MNISIIGAGHVGLVTGACFAELGHQVMMADHDRTRIMALKKRHLPFYEPGLPELVGRGLRKRRLRLTTSIEEAVQRGTVIFLCVGTPSRPNGEADLTAVEDVTRQIAKAMRAYRVIVEKSTVPVQTGEWVKKTCRLAARPGVPFDIASNPEFLREGSAVEDFMHPDRIVLGVESARAKTVLLDLYKPFNAPLVVTDIKSAELIKHASNSYLAMKVSYINMLAQLCDQVGADVLNVAEGMGLDARIGRAFLQAGIGYGGSCFPKDVSAFIRIAEQHGCAFPLLRAAAQINAEQRALFVKRVTETLWNLNRKTIAVWGVSFKPETDDLRESPALEIIRLLRQEGVTIRAFDPQAMPQAKRVLKGVTFCKDAYDAARGSDAVALLTEWEVFRKVDWRRVKSLLRQPVIFDGRNIYHAEPLTKLGFRYVGIGRGQRREE